MLRRLLLGGCVCALGLSGASTATGASIFTDGPNASGNAINVGTVTVSNDFDSADVSRIRFVISSNQVDMKDQDRIGVVVDSDMNAATGDPTRFGADYWIDIDGNGNAGGTLGPSTQFIRWDASVSDWVGEPEAPTSTPFDVSIARSKLGNTRGFRFYVYTVYPDDGSTPQAFDFAPDTGVWTYTDDSVPTATAVRSTPVTATRNKLEWSVYDDSGEARTIVRINRIGSSTPTATLDFGPVANGPRSTNWPVPATIRGYQRFCVQAIDSFDNAVGATASCKHVKFRRIRPQLKIQVTDSGSSQIWERMWLEGLPRYTYVTIDCVRRCRSLHEHRTARRRTFVSRKFSGVRLPDRSVIVIRVTKPRWVGFYDRIKVGSGGTFSQVRRCMAPGLRSPSPRGVCS
jgi:hypothetical protein